MSFRGIDFKTRKSFKRWWQEVHERYNGKLNLPLFRGFKLIQYACLAWMGYYVILYATTLNTYGFRILFSRNGLVATVIVLGAFYVETSLDLVTEYLKKKILESA